MSETTDHTPQRSRRLPRAPKGFVGTAVKLTLACLAVGAALTAFGINPIGLWRGLFRAVTDGVREVYTFGLDGVAVVLAVIATGAVVVLPIWGFKRLIGLLRR